MAKQWTDLARWLRRHALGLLLLAAAIAVCLLVWGAWALPD